MARYKPGYQKKWVKGDRNYSDPRYTIWRKAVKARDGYKCRMCKANPGDKYRALICHHIRRWADMPTLKFMVSNGITLCRKCHKIVTGNEDAYAPLCLKLIMKKVRNDYKKAK